MIWSSADGSEDKTMRRTRQLLKSVTDMSMTDIVLAEWRSAPDMDMCVNVIPDGCCDLIMRAPQGEKPHWFVSSLDASAYTVSIEAGVFMKGLRLKPGTRIDEKRLLASVQRQHFEFEDLSSRIASFTHLPRRVVEALDCLASDVSSIARAATELGVSQRSLQRLLKRETGRPPVYWMLLARVRKAARAAFEPLPLAEIAAMHGYADQAHMSREHKRWLNVSPSKLRCGSEVLDQLSASGYG